MCTIMIEMTLSHKFISYLYPFIRSELDKKRHKVINLHIYNEKTVEYKEVSRKMLIFLNTHYTNKNKKDFPDDTI